MRIVISKNRILHFALILIFYIFFEFRYFYFVFEKFESSRFLFEFSLGKYVFSKILFVLAIYIANISKTKFIYLTITLFNIFVLIPNLILFQFNNSSVIISLLIILFFVFLSVDFFEIPKVKLITIKKSQVLLTFLISILLLLIPFIYTFGLHIDLKIFEFSTEIYKVRKEAKELANIYTSYMYFPLKNFILPIFIIFAFIERKKYYLFIGVAIVLYLFIIIPHKSTFFSIFVIIAFYFFKDYDKKLTFILVGLLSIIIVSVFFTEYINSNLLESIFLRRMFFVPAQLNTAYFEVFKDNNICLSHSVLSSYIDYPFKLEPAFYVADVYFNEPEMSANNGFIGDGFMNFGIIGSISFAFIISLIFKFFDKLNISSRFYGVIFLFIRLTIGSAFLTMFLTHGLLVFIIISIIFLKDTKLKYDK